MSTTTPNYGLVKPELTDVADITAMNPNWDKIDKELKEFEKAFGDITPEGIGALPDDTVIIKKGGTGAETEAGAVTNLLNGNQNQIYGVTDYIDIPYGIAEGVYSGLKTNDPFTVTGAKRIYTVRTKGSSDSISTIMVTCLDGGDDTGRTFIGYCSGNTVRWEEIANANAYLPLDGSVAMTGALFLKNRQSRLYGNDQLMSMESWNSTGSSNRRYLSVYNAEAIPNLKDALEFTDVVNGEFNYYKVFGQHNKPTGYYYGNGSATTRTIDIGGTGTILWIKSAKYLTFVWNFGGFTLDGTNGSVKFHPSSQLDFENGTLTIATTHSAVNDTTNVHYYGYLN